MSCSIGNQLSKWEFWNFKSITKVPYLSQDLDILPPTPICQNISHSKIFIFTSGSQGFKVFVFLIKGITVIKHRSGFVLTAFLRLPLFTDNLKYFIFIYCIPMNKTFSSLILLFLFSPPLRFYSKCTFSLYLISCPFHCSQHANHALELSMEF